MRLSRRDKQRLRTSRSARRKKLLRNTLELEGADVTKTLRQINSQSIVQLEEVNMNRRSERGTRYYKSNNWNSFDYGKHHRRRWHDLDDIWKPNYDDDGYDEWNASKQNQQSYSNYDSSHYPNTTFSSYEEHGSNGRWSGNSYQNSYVRQVPRLPYQGDYRFKKDQNFATSQKNPNNSQKKHEAKNRVQCPTKEENKDIIDENMQRIHGNVTEIEIKVNGNDSNLKQFNINPSLSYLENYQYRPPPNEAVKENTETLKVKTHTNENSNHTQPKVVNTDEVSKNNSSNAATNKEIVDMVLVRDTYVENILKPVCNTVNLHEKDRCENVDIIKPLTICRIPKDTNKNIPSKTTNSYGKRKNHFDNHSGNLKYVVVNEPVNELKPTVRVVIKPIFDDLPSFKTAPKCEDIAKPAAKIKRRRQTLGPNQELTNDIIEKAFKFETPTKDNAKARCKTTSRRKSTHVPLEDDVCEIPTKTIKCAKIRGRRKTVAVLPELDQELMKTKIGSSCTEFKITFSQKTVGESMPELTEPDEKAPTKTRSSTVNPKASKVTRSKSQNLKHDLVDPLPKDVTKKYRPKNIPHVSEITLRDPRLRSSDKRQLSVKPKLDKTSSSSDCIVKSNGSRNDTNISEDDLNFLFGDVKSKKPGQPLVNSQTSVPWTLKELDVPNLQLDIFFKVNKPAAIVEGFRPETTSVLEVTDHTLMVEKATEKQQAEYLIEALKCVEAPKILNDQQVISTTRANKKTPQKHKTTTGPETTANVPNQMVQITYEDFVNEFYYFIFSYCDTQCVLTQKFKRFSSCGFPSDFIRQEIYDFKTCYKNKLRRFCESVRAFFANRYIPSFDCKTLIYYCMFDYYSTGSIILHPYILKLFSTAAWEISNDGPMNEFLKVFCDSIIKVMKENVQKTNQSVPTTKPAAQQHIPTAQQIVPTGQQRIPAVQRSIPAAQGSIPTAQQSKPTAQQRKPTAQQRKPTAQQRKPTVQQCIPTPQERIPTPQQSIPPAQQSISTAQQRISTDQQSIPSAQHSILTVQQRIPTPQERIPTPQQSIPTAQQRIPTTKKSISTAQQRMPAAQQRIPTAQQQNQLIAQQPSVSIAQQSLLTAQPNLQAAQHNLIGTQLANLIPQESVQQGRRPSPPSYLVCQQQATQQPQKTQQQRRQNAIETNGKNKNSTYKMLPQHRAQFILQCGVYCDLIKSFNRISDQPTKSQTRGHEESSPSIVQTAGALLSTFLEKITSTAFSPNQNLTNETEAQETIVEVNKDLSFLSTDNADNSRMRLPSSQPLNRDETNSDVPQNVTPKIEPKVEVKPDVDMLKSVKQELDQDTIDVDEWFTNKMRESDYINLDDYFLDDYPVKPESDQNANTIDTMGVSPGLGSVDSGFASPPNQIEHPDVLISGERTCICNSKAELVCLCGKAIYCSTTCQRTDWTYHKEQCLKTRDAS